MTLWHITFTTYGTRLHGDERGTVDRHHNQPSTFTLAPDPSRQATARARMSAEPVVLTPEQRRFLESTLPELCADLGLTHLVSAAAPDHIHLLVQISENTHGKRARALIKRRLTQALDQSWSCPKRADGSSWWSEGGSARAVRDEHYRINAIRYIEDQRATTNP